MGKYSLVFGGVLVALVVYSTQYIHSRNQQAMQYGSSVLFVPSYTVGDVILRLKDAPTMICELRTKGSDAEIPTKAYVFEGEMKIASVDSTNVTSYSFFNTDSLVIWKEGDPVSHAVPANTLYTFIESDVHCSPWWLPSLTVFSHPPIN